MNEEEKEETRVRALKQAAWILFLPIYFANQKEIKIETKAKLEKEKSEGGSAKVRIGNGRKREFKCETRKRNKTGQQGEEVWGD